MTPSMTIILPHKRNPGNDAALKVALECLFDNTRNDFILIIDAAEDKPLYPRVNSMVGQSTTDCCVYWSSDMFAAPDWDVPMLELWEPDTFVTNVLVEPGVIGMHPDNVHMDFGRKPETFRRAEFEEWCKTAPVPNNFGWYAPYMFSRWKFLDFGGLHTGLAGDHQGFTPADQLLFEKWQAAGRHIKRARSYTYHLQRYSEQDEQEHDKRETQS